MKNEMVRAWRDASAPHAHAVESREVQSQLDARAVRHASRAGTTYARFVGDVARAGGYTSPQATDYTVAVIATLEEKLSLRAVRGLEAQLPSRLGEALATQPIYDRPSMRPAEFHDRVATKLGVSSLEARAATRIVLGVLLSHVSPGEARHIQNQIGDELTASRGDPDFELD